MASISPRGWKASRSRGRCCLSEDGLPVRCEARLDLEVNDLGQKELKNIVEPVRVYSLRVGLLPEPSRRRRSMRRMRKNPRRGSPCRTEPSIAVLPFVNMSGDPEQEYFADGITEDLITALSRIRWFFVIARNSCFAYKGKARRRPSRGARAWRALRARRRRAKSGRSRPYHGAAHRS